MRFPETNALYVHANSRSDIKSKCRYVGIILPLPISSVISLSHAFSKCQVVSSFLQDAHNTYVYYIFDNMKYHLLCLYLCSDEGGGHLIRSSRQYVPGGIKVNVPVVMTHGQMSQTIRMSRL